MITPELQSQILKKCSSEESSVSEELARHGLSVNSLRYLNDFPLSEGGPSIDELPGRASWSPKIPAISFFSGAGGMDLGLEAAGFKTMAAFEYEQIFCETLRRNFPGTAVFGPPTHAGDLYDVEEIITTIEGMGIRTGFEGLFHGGPPCQPFSIAANQRFNKTSDNFKRIGFGAERGNLTWRFFEIVRHFRPRALIIENVAGLNDIDGGIELGRVVQALESEGYSVAKPVLLNAKYYDVPQERKRLFVVAYLRGSSFVFPPARPIVTSWEALSRRLNTESGNLVRDHKADSILRYMKLQFGERDHLGRVDRLDPFKPSKTIIAGGRSGGGRSHLHPLIPRTLSPRESARLQTFPDLFEFAGTGARQFTQIGNAVPPMLAFHIGGAVRRAIFEV